MPKHTFLSQQTVNQQIEKLETLIRVGELMDWEGIEGELVNSYYAIQRETIIECQATLKQLDRDIENLANSSEQASNKSVSIFRNIAR
ncbi:MAG: hypothetical protein CMK64_12810 [Pseudoalteromonas sp.]|nr:hypothetical protein [Pseudoalteromonas sp.]|tara:strand:+ start:473 stop:736 length:264 start_codon:yes stop_codon:yes gene_type:complete